MMKDLTKDEMLWRYVNLTEYITNEIEENNIEVQSEDKDVDYWKTRARVTPAPIWI